MSSKDDPARGIYWEPPSNDRPPHSRKLRHMAKVLTLKGAVIVFYAGQLAAIVLLLLR